MHKKKAFFRLVKSEHILKKFFSNILSIMHKKKPFKGLFRLVKSEQKKRGIYFLSCIKKKPKKALF